MVIQGESSSWQQMRYAISCSREETGSTPSGWQRQPPPDKAHWLVRIGLAFALLLMPLAAAAAPEVYLVDLRGPIGPVTADYVVRGLHLAADNDAAVIVLRMDTPGGLDTSMREIIRAILASPVPVACFVAPSGARAHGVV